MDHESLENDTITLRNRDDMTQERIKISELESKISEKLALSNLF